MLRPSSPVCAKASPRRPCYTLDRSAFVPCPEKRPGAQKDGSPPASPDQSRVWVFAIRSECSFGSTGRATGGSRFHNVKEQGAEIIFSVQFVRVSVEEVCSPNSLLTANLSAINSAGWWSRSGSNRRPQACKARALPTELRPRIACAPVSLRCSRRMACHPKLLKKRRGGGPGTS